MRTFTKLLKVMVVGALLSAAVLGCNTVKGAGKDVERGGEKIQGAAQGAHSH